MLARLDELPSTAPPQTLITRMAMDRATGISFIYAVQTWRVRGQRHLAVRLPFGEGPGQDPVVLGGAQHSGAQVVFDRRGAQAPAP